MFKFICYHGLLVPVLSAVFSQPLWNQPSILLTLYLLRLHVLIHYFICQILLRKSKIPTARKWPFSSKRAFDFRLLRDPKNKRSLPCGEIHQRRVITWHSSNPRHDNKTTPILPPPPPKPVDTVVCSQFFHLPVWSYGPRRVVRGAPAIVKQNRLRWIMSLSRSYPFVGGFLSGNFIDQFEFEV